MLSRRLGIRRRRRTDAALRRIIRRLDIDSRVLDHHYRLLRLTSGHRLCAESYLVGSLNRTLLGASFTGVSTSALLPSSRCLRADDSCSIDKGSVFCSAVLNVIVSGSVLISIRTSLPSTWQSRCPPPTRK